MSNKDEFECNDTITSDIRENIQITTKQSQYNLCKNAFGNYEHKETKFLFDKDNFYVWGKQLDDGNVRYLSIEDVSLCIENDFKYYTPFFYLREKPPRHPEYNQRFIISVKSKPETETNDETPEFKYKNFLLNVFCQKWENKFTQLISTTKNIEVQNDVFMDISSMNVKNIYELEFHGHEISFKPRKNRYYIEFQTNRFVDGIYTNEYTTENYLSDIFCVKSSGSSIKELFVNVINEINRYIFCKSCGHIKNIDTYYKQEQKCESCLLNEIISLEKEKSIYCTICMENTKHYYKLRCGHEFHRHCLSDLKSKICPLCRTCINEEDEVYIE